MGAGSGARWCGQAAGPVGTAIRSASPKPNDQVVEKPPPQLGGPYQPGVRLEQPVAPGGLDSCSDGPVGQPGPFLKQARIEAGVQAQGEQGELQGQVVRVQGPAGARKGPIPNGCQIGVRVAPLGGALDPPGRGIGELGVGPGAYP